MQIKNTATDYGVIAKSLHWATAFLFLGAYVSVYYRHWFTEKDTSANWTALQLHLSVGVSVAVIVVLRLVWRVMNRAPDFEPGTRFAHIAARVGHYALYGVMVLAPLTGYLGTGVDTEYFFMFDIPKFESTQLYSILVTEMLGLSFETFERPIDFLHKAILGEWLVWLLIAGHVFAALYHHYVKKDRTLKKMTIERKL